MRPAIIVHGGAGDWDNESDHADAVQGVYDAVKIGWEILSSGGSALDAVEDGVKFLENHPLYDAGIGSHLNQLGRVEMDALFIDGKIHNYGAVAGVQHVQHPISLARHILEDGEHCFIVGDGADRLAVKLGFEVIPNISFVTNREWERFRSERDKKEKAKATGTVGVVAIDSQGNIASGTSTGGTPHKLDGRVGDTPLFGAGGYVENDFGGASATGVGENIMRVMLSHYAIQQLKAGLSAQEAATASAHYINSFFEDSQAGIILVDKQGRVGAAHTTQAMMIGWADEDGNLHASMGGGIDGLRHEGRLSLP